MLAEGGEYRGYLDARYYSSARCNVSLIDMYYRDGSNWVNMPYWAVSYISLGSAIAIQKDPKHRLVVGLAVPVRAYAATLTALGIVIERAKIPSDNIEVSKYLAYLKTIERGVSVMYCPKEDWYPGNFVGLQQVGGKPFIAIIWKRGRERCKVTLPVSQAITRLQISGSTENDYAGKTVGRRLVHNKDFLKIILGGNNTNEFVVRSRLECLIIGCVNTLRHEIKETQISLGTNHIAGTIQDVLRVRKFLGADSAYRSNVIPINREQSSHSFSSDIPYMTIFDGALSFLKWRDYWRKSNWIVLLDKTESCFREAVDQLNQEYVERRVRDAILASTLELPQGSEFLAFQEDFE